ncbi:MAG: hypothetical protein CMQ12_07170 [Gammaproteobacteria bacterium]|jgi:hypothetical protein|nr:hypothetical protein [Gammaproteobacteria bacterium]
MKLRKLASLAAFGVLCSFISIAVSADHHVVKQEREIIIEADGEPGNLAEILQRVEAEMGDTGNIAVFIDDEGNVTVDQFDLDHEVIIAGEGDMPNRMLMKKMIGPHRMHGRSSPMSESVASCVLKNIKNANTDAAAHFIREACVALTEDK